VAILSKSLANFVLEQTLHTLASLLVSLFQGGSFLFGGQSRAPLRHRSNAVREIAGGAEVKNAHQKQGKRAFRRLRRPYLRFNQGKIGFLYNYTRNVPKLYA
jgi:hypothetical protein